MYDENSRMVEESLLPMGNPQVGIHTIMQSRISNRRFNTVIPKHHASLCTTSGHTALLCGNDWNSAHWLLRIVSTPSLLAPLETFHIMLYPHASRHHIMWGTTSVSSFFTTPRPPSDCIFSGPRQVPKPKFCRIVGLPSRCKPKRSYCEFMDTIRPQKGSWE